jgi:hypothetical protein
MGAVDASWRQGDFNGDGVVTIADLIDAITNYGLRDQALTPTVLPASAAAAAVPEPDACALAALATASLLRRRRAR